MNCEVIKNEFIKLKKEELNYIDNVAKTSSTKKLSEYEKLEIYRTLNNYKEKINKLLIIFGDEIINDERFRKQDLKEIIIEFDINKDFLSFMKCYSEYYKYTVFKELGIDIESYKFNLNIYDLIYTEYMGIDSDKIQNNQKLIENPIYIFCGYFDDSDDCYGPLIGNLEDYLYAIYEDVCGKYNENKKIWKANVEEFEKDKIIIHSKKYVHSSEIRKIFNEELLNSKNQTLNDCVIKTRNRIDELNYTRSPEYKEKVLMKKINDLYKKVKGEFICEEILYSGDFLQIIRETYRLPNGNIVSKEKNIKNRGKDSVIIIAITQENEYIITFQNRIKDKIIAEFPAGYIENNETPIEAAKRELKEETGYVSDNLFIIDEAYTTPGTDNSKTYIVIANNCIKIDKKSENGTELVEYGLFSEKELEYLINKKIMNGAMNKLAYYNLVNNADECKILHIKSNKRIIKKL